MEALLLRLSPGDSEAETALRIIAYFDRLVEHAGDMGDLLRSAARLVRAPAGYIDPAGRGTLSFAASGLPAAVHLPSGAVTRDLPRGSGATGRLWLGSEADDRIQALVLERMAIAAGVIFGRSGGPAADQDTWTAHLLSSDLPVDELERLCRALGLHLRVPARVVVMSGEDKGAAMSSFVEDWCTTSGDAHLACVPHEGCTISVVQASGTVPASAPPGTLVATGATVPLHALTSSWRSAVVALRLTSSWLGPQLVHHEDLGPLRHIAAVDPEAAADTFEVAQLRHLAETETGLGGIKALDAFCRHGSLRSAAAELHLHHSSLAHRLDIISRRLHLSLDTPDGRLRARLALQLYRVAAWSTTAAS